MLKTTDLPRRLRRLLAPMVATVAVGGVAAGCQERPLCPIEPRSTGVVVERLTNNQVDKVDVLLAIDNSSSMADKQALLALAVPDLVEGLVNPPCIDATGAPVLPGPEGPLEKCPKGTDRLFPPVLDIHIGVISSSLGDHGADSCDASDEPSNEDMGHLLFRSDEAGANDLPTYQDKGFLAWDPAQELNPKGEADLAADTAVDPNDTALLPVLQDMIRGTGQRGCGYESQLESWYRFLVDPAPYKTLTVNEKGSVVLEGVDETLLAQRASFLRPDSLLAILQLSDENDCSVRETQNAYVVLQLKDGNGNAFRMWKPRSECATDPNDQCCFSCAQKGPKDDDGNPLCAPDPSCTDTSGNVAKLDATEDAISVRCWDQKRRFGIDFLYPIERYTEALTSETVTGRDGQIAQNPLFMDLDDSDQAAPIRDKSMVVFTGIVGVPWQDIARDPKDLTKGFKSYDEMSDKDASGHTTWDVVLGDPANYIPPLDPLMIESREMRKGTNPVTGDKLVTWETPLDNPINGHEYSAWALQYACIFDLPAPLTCEGLNCGDPYNSPVYDPPYDGMPTMQYRAGAQPGTRFLSLLKSIGSQGVPASVCPAQTTDDTRLDFGYQPAVAAALSRLQLNLTRSCMPRTLDPDEDGQVTCVVIEASHSQNGGACCDPDKARLVPPEERSGAIEAIRNDTVVVSAGYDCFCEIPQLTGTDPGEPLWSCQNDTAKSPLLDNGDSVDGYCYIDQSVSPPIGNADLVAGCPDTEKRTIRFVGAGNIQSGARAFITCMTEDQRPQVECDPR